jgi:hypothetical protein
MRPTLIATLGSIACIIISAAPTHAAPSPMLQLLYSAIAGGMIQKVDYLRHYSCGSLRHLRNELCRPLHLLAIRLEILGQRIQKCLVEFVARALGPSRWIANFTQLGRFQMSVLWSDARRSLICFQCLPADGATGIS